MAKMNHDESYLEMPKDWFLFEDQTIGYPMVAGLINQGYSAKQVKNMIDIIEKTNLYYGDHLSRPFISEMLFNVTEGYGLKEFANACEEVRDSKK